MAKKKPAAPSRYVVKYEFHGSPHYGAFTSTTVTNCISKLRMDQKLPL